MDENRQLEIIEEIPGQEAGSDQPVECMGQKFSSDMARREHYAGLLAERLKDPEFRKIEGFPIGTDEAILALSDPPYYTACPNPFIGEWLAENSKPYDPETDDYHREPFAADVSEGKNDPIYNAHSYHTKVPHKAIMRYILHYTEPGDVVFDGFCGTGMTGVAAQMCGSKEDVESLGYKIQADGTVVDGDQKFSSLGKRLCVLNDLSPIATFVSSNYVDSLAYCSDFVQEALSVIKETERQYPWLYSSNKKRVLSAIWSDVFLCPNCSGEIVYWSESAANGEITKSFPCPHCRTIVGKAASTSGNVEKLERPFTQVYDPALSRMSKIPKFVLVKQVCLDGRAKLSLEATDEDRQVLNRQLEQVSWPVVPDVDFPSGRQTNKLINGSGISNVCHMYTSRALLAYSALWNKELSCPLFTRLFRFCLTAVNNYISRKQGYFGGGGGVAGTLFTPSIHLERNVFDVLTRKVKQIAKLRWNDQKSSSVLTTQSLADLSNIPDNCIDYIFTDPPFGESLQYAELNFFVEAWLKVYTAVQQDCVLNYVHQKDLRFYTRQMSSAFAQYARVLKPGHWISIEFHNSQNAVWNAIQQAVESAGFVVADVRILDKQQKSFNAVNRAGAVDQDLVITAYKPSEQFEFRIKKALGTQEAGAEFVRQHLAMLPIAPFSINGKLEVVAERTKHLLFDRLVAYHLQHGLSIPISAADFYIQLEREFYERDGMYFLPDQAARYDAARVRTDVEPLSLFVKDERTALQWVRNRLQEEPQTLGELTPKFMQEIQTLENYEALPELRDLLKENFIPGDDGRWRVPNPDSERDIEAMRRKALLRVFESYTKFGGQLKTFRKEAILEGFKHCWQTKQFGIIVAVCEKIPAKILQDIQEFVQFYDIAKDLAPEPQPQLEFTWEA